MFTKLFKTIGNAILCVVLGVVAVSCSDKVIETALDRIDINLSSAEGFVPCKDIFDTTQAKICVLNKDVGYIDAFKVTDDITCILSGNRQKIQLFDGNGVFLKEIYHVGKSALEYVEIADFYVSDSNVYVLDTFSRKIVVYSLSGTKAQKIDISNYWANSLFVLDGDIFLVNEGSDTANGKYHLFRIDTNGRLIDSYIKFKENPGLTSDICYAQYKDTVYYIQRDENMIYLCNTNGIVPLLKFDFGKYNMPEQYLSMDARRLMSVSDYKDYCLGIDGIKVSEQYIFVTFSAKNNNYVAIYDRHAQTLLHICRGIAIKGQYGIGLMNYRISDNTIYDIYYADELSVMLEEKFKSGTTISENYSKQLHELQKQIKGKYFPVIFKYYLE